MRLRISPKVANARNICEGEFFRAVTNMRSVQAYIAYSQISSDTGTFNAKSSHILRVSLNAEAFFSGRSVILKGKESAVSKYFHTTAACYKNAVRDEACKRKY